MTAPSFEQSRVLILDYDGTLSPLVPDRSRAYPYPGISELLDTIMTDCDTTVAIVSGRPARDITALLRTRVQPDIWGCHGLERLDRNGQFCSAALDGRTIRVLQDAQRKLVERGLEAAVETKSGSVSVHWRGLSLNHAEQVKAAAYQSLARFIGCAGLVLSEFDGGVELRSPACNKRSAIEKILAEVGPIAAVAYLGDDQTDEDAFRALNDRGLTILVGRRYRFTAAQFWLCPPDDLKHFLQDWIRACRGEL